MIVLGRRQFVGSLSAGAAAIALGGLSACNQQSDIQRVLSLLPTISGIVETVGTVLETVDPALALPITMALSAIEAAFTIVTNILTQYESNLSGAPQSVLQTLDNAIAAIETQISSIEALFPNLSPIAVLGIKVALEAFQTILSLIASLIPAPAASVMFPGAYRSLSARNVRFGVSASIPTRRQFAKLYNANMDHAGFHSAHIHVPLL